MRIRNASLFPGVPTLSVAEGLTCNVTHICLHVSDVVVYSKTKLKQLASVSNYKVHLLKVQVFKHVKPCVSQENLNKTEAATLVNEKGFNGQTFRGFTG